jgi:hypothetical protein
MKFSRFAASGIPGPLKLDFRRPAAGWAGVSRTGLAVLALGLLLAGGQIWRYLDMQGRLVAAEDSVADLLKKSAAMNRSGAVDMGQGEALRHLNQPWDRLLKDLAAAASPDLALLTLEADGVRGRLRLLGEGKNLDEVLAYVHRLGASSSLMHPELVSHEMRQVDGQPVVGFTIQAGWGPR